VEATHGAMAAEEVLDRPRENVMDARATVGRRRPLEKDELRLPFGLGERLLKEIFLLPESENFLL
jgi:hypothetical protein